MTRTLLHFPRASQAARRLTFGSRNTAVLPTGPGSPSIKCSPLPQPTGPRDLPSPSLSHSWQSHGPLWDSAHRTLSCPGAFAPQMPCPLLFTGRAASCHSDRSSDHSLRPDAPPDLPSAAPTLETPQLRFQDFIIEMRAVGSPLVTDFSIDKLPDSLKCVCNRQTSTRRFRFIGG